MKIGKMGFCSIAIMALALRTAYADIHINATSPSFKAQESPCSQFVGAWSGNAVVEKVCKYTGKAIVSSAAELGRYNIRVELHPDDGYFWCPSADPIQLQGNCNGGDVVINTPNSVHLDGTTNGSHVHLTGTIDVKGISMHVDSLDLNKQ